MKTKFKNADEAYNYFLNEIRSVGIDFAGTRALFNIGFTHYGTACETVFKTKKGNGT
jgi:hypothetical protein